MSKYEECFIFVLWDLYFSADSTASEKGYHQPNMDYYDSDDSELQVMLGAGVGRSEKITKR